MCESIARILNHTFGRVLFGTLLLSISQAWAQLDVEGPAAKISADWNYVEEKLQKAKFKAEFIEDLKKVYKSKDFTKILENNLLLYLRKTDVHTPQISPQAVRDIKRFVKKNKSTLERAEKEYGVNGSVIASLMWLESRYGKNLGTYSVAVIYAHLLQADRPEVVSYLKKKSLDYLERPSNEVRKEIVKRANDKSKWALKELKALAKLHKDNDEVLKKLKGSWAGAMGMPQFIPSSYVAYAKSSKKEEDPDLNKADDAILSVANYLKKNGWRKSEKTHTKALLRYNKSDDYVSTILELASKVDSDRGLSSVKSKNKKTKPE